MADRFQEVFQLVFESLGEDKARQLEQILRQVGDAGGAADDKLTPLVDNLADLAAKSALVNRALDLKTRLAENQSALDKATQSFADLNAEFDRTDKSSIEITTAFEQAQKQVRALAAEQLRLQNASATTNDKIKQAGIDTANLGAASASLKVKTQEAAQQLTKEAQAAKENADAHAQAASRAKEAGSAFEFVKQHLAAIISVAAAASIALKGIAFGRESLKNAEAVEVSLSRVKALAAGAAGQFDAMDDAVQSAAQSVNVSTQESAAGLAALAAAGNSANDSMKLLVPTLQLAKIANIDVAQAADIVDNTLDAFGLSADNAQSVVDKLTQASHGAAGGLGAISQAAAKLAPDAKAIGLGFDDVVSLLGILADNGQDATKAVGGLRDVFQALQDPTSKLRQGLRDLGDGGADFSSAVKALNGGSSQARDTLNQLTGSARSTILALGQAGPDALRKFQAQLEGASGAASRTASVLDDNLRGASTRFGNAIEQIGEKLAQPVLAPFTEELTKLAGELNTFAQSKDFADIQKQVGEMAKNAADAIDKFVHGIDWKSFLAGAKDSLSGVVDGMRSVAESATAIASAVNKAGSVVGAAWDTAAAGVHGAAAVVAGAAGTAVKAVGDVAQTMGELSGASSTAENKLQMLGESLLSASDTNLHQVVPSLKAAGEHLANLADSTDSATAATERSIAPASQNAATQKQVADATQASAQAQRVLATVIPDTTSGAQAQTQALTQLADQLRQADAQGRAAATGMDALKGAFADLHVVSQQNLEQAAVSAARAFATIDAGSANTAAGLADRQKAFLAYARAALAASAGLDAGNKAATQSLLESKAAQLDLLDELQAIEKSGTSGSERLTAALHNQSAETREASDAAKELGENADEAGKKSVKSFDNAASAVGAVANSIAGFRAQFASISDAAAKAFDKNLLGEWNQQFDSTGANIGRSIRALNQALADTNNQIAIERAQLQGMIASVGSGAEKSTATINSMIDAIKNGTYQFGVLGKQDLAPLLTALEQAKQRTEAADAAAKSAAERFAQLAQSIHDQLLQERGDQDALENERHQNQLQALADAAAAGKVNQEQYQQAVADENALHALKMQHLQAEQQADKGAGNGGSGTGAGGASPTTAEISPSATSPGGAGSPQSANGSSRAAGFGGITIQLYSTVTDPRTLDDFARKIKTQLDAIERRSQ